MSVSPAQLRRAPLLVTIDSSGDGKSLGRCLESVLAAVRVDDLVVVCAADVERAEKLAGRHRQVSVVPHPRHRLSARLTEHARTVGGAAVVMEDHAIFPGGRRWLNDLLAALSDPAVGTSAPMTNGASYPQCPRDVPGLNTTKNEIRDTMNRCSQSRHADPIPLSITAGPCVAVSPELLRQLPPELVDFSPQTFGEAAAVFGMRQVAVPKVYVQSTKNLPLITACMIMKDEVAFLEQCLASVKGLCDEVVIYDTGSTDGSVELARTLGATVIEGYWDDDFSRARNESLAYCRGEWVLHIDPDEEIESSPDQIESLRSGLFQTTSVDGLALRLYNLQGSRHAYVRNTQFGHVLRMFRRTHFRWFGALHEQPELLNGAKAKLEETDLVVFIHHGYLDEYVNERDKKDRNLRIIESRQETVTEPGKAHFDTGRSMALAERPEEALEEYAKAAAVATLPLFRRAGLEFGASGLIDLGRYDEARELVAELRKENSPAPGVPDWLEAKICLGENNGARALELLDGIAEYNDRFSNNTIDTLHLMRCGAYTKMERIPEAAEEAVLALSHNVLLADAWALLGHAAALDAEPLRRAAAAVPTEILNGVLAKLLGRHPLEVHRVTQALWDTHQGSKQILALVTDLAPHLNVDQLAEWAGPMRQVGWASMCPLAACAHDETRSPQERRDAAALLVERFGDERGKAVLVKLEPQLVTE